ncbi:MFS transporter [Trinickia caryophylli]|uniref:Sugar phosphate permease n=1 Tax=Trinickia caryophylli TaxID=28094 RepID=A0A1X7E9V6_TRICW|nr:MFS transporter [Trinickia caryophylli]PMS13097.1 MFS transporter [Trinickia caryophylli]TRX14757.1 MFS transporter [Trinickia caryophylli]WQE14604.1 MFS transporter [Trinickia caryophylli]SMF30141.1 Sugar phosphate permease [Trinickia caryophylli]GLU31981.1 MFS transporter [Trinickia caryophylli]
METGKPGRSGNAGRWAVLALLAFGVLISFIDRTSISSTLADAAFIRHFALTNVDRGWINAAFFWSYGAFQIPMGWVADRYGVKWPYAISFALWCLATALMGAVTALAGLVVMRLVIGMAEAIVIPASYRWIRNHFDETQNGFAVGILAMGNKFGPALGAPVGAWFIVHHSWQAMFIVTGLAGLVWLVPWLLLVRNDFPSKTMLAQAHRSARSVTLASILSSPVVWGGMITNFCYGYFTFYCMTWMPAYLVEQRHLSLSRSGLFTFFSFAGIAIVAAVAGWAADRIIARGHNPILVRKVFVIAGFVGGSTVVFGAYAGSLEMALFWNVLSLSLLGFVTANNLALSRLTLIPRQCIGLVTGVQQVATSLAGGVAASLSGWLLHVSGSYGLPMRVILVFLLIGAAATAILYRPEWAPRETQAEPELKRAWK